MIQADRNTPSVPSHRAPPVLSFAGAAVPARQQLSSALDKELVGYHGHAHHQLLQSPAHAAPPAFTAATHAHDWLLPDGYPAFLAADASSAWDPADYGFPSGVVPMPHPDGFGHMIAAHSHDAHQAQSESAFGWSTVPASGAAAATSQEAAAPGPASAPAQVRRNSTSSSCAGSSCSSACVYGEQCDIPEPCALGDECGLDQPCDASDCGDEPVCVDESCTAYTSEETKAAATLASFVATDAVTAPSSQRQPLDPLQTSHATLSSTSSIVAQQTPANHTHCDASMAAPQTVIQHLIERHNDPSADSCVRPCLVDQPPNYAFCPMPCLLQHPQLHGHEYSCDNNMFFTALDGSSLMDCYNPSVLASECSAHWTSGDELLQHWHMQHRTMFPPAQQQHHHHDHQVEPEFNAITSHERLQTPSYMSSQEDPLAVHAHLSLGSASSPATTLTNDTSTIATPLTGASTALSPSPTTPAGHRENAPVPKDALRTGGPDAINELFQCLWCDAPGSSCCGQVFDNPKDLNLHVIGYHVKMLERGDGGYVCGWKDCKRSSEGKKGFPQKSKIERHVQTHTGEKPYKCPTCHITFSAKQALDQHELIHKNSKPLPCEFPGCDKTFRQQSARTMHMRTHTKVKPLACNICGRRFSESSNLSKHRRTHAEVGAFMCRYPGCTKTFHRQDQLRRHKKTHETKIKIRRGADGGCQATPAAVGHGDNLGIDSASTSPDMSESEPL
ncbi:zinc finger protein 664 [Magnaporthiopsis poae ATCC 64411]|uniref:Zinc finger protein 664 n=1 Tax=Magnaporthiopsis poae (strain ATCC 64411 / 73-15) TaxID=644358 RepID=A0A0C4DTH3_MAGP6|nr:zinc finger protein 664 [Magnaporthiopsis poae ATCC 64411]